MSQGGTVGLTYEKWREHLAELEDLRRENEDLRRRPQGDVVWEKQVARLLRGQEQLREENRRLRAELADSRRMHEGGNPAP